MAGNKKNADKSDKSSKDTNKSASKGKGKEDKSGESSGGKLKAATSINVRHILVSWSGIPQPFTLLIH